MIETQSAQTLKLLKMRSAKVPSEVLEREFAKRDAEVLANLRATLFLSLHWVSL